jgi:hypothetical protein
MAEFQRELALTIIDKLLIGLLLVVVAFFVNRSLERLKADLSARRDYEALRDKATLEHLQQQITLLYSPLLGLTERSRVIKGLAIQKGWEYRQYFDENYFIPLNIERANLIIKHYHLLETDELLPSFRDFLEHATNYEVLHKLWAERGISSDEIKGEDWPIDFEGDVRASLNQLKDRYNKLYQRISERSSRS